MKKALLSILLLLPAVVFGQKDVTTFLGIPVDGSKNSMIQSLKSKGFVYKNNEYLTGEFNGCDVEVRVMTNNNKVWRIAISDIHSQNETDIKIRFNKLVSQFSKNPKYIAANFEDANSYLLSNEEEIGYGINIYHKRYEASFYQQPDISLIDTLEIQNEIRLKIQNKFGERRIQKPDDEVQQEAKKEAIRYFFSLVDKKSVWFMISKERHDRFYITMFYDNEYNHSDGEDL